MAKTNSPNSPNPDATDGTTPPSSSDGAAPPAAPHPDAAAPAAATAPHPVVPPPAAAAPPPPGPAPALVAPSATATAPPAAGNRTPDGKLTRYGMEQVIRSGGSVLHDGVVRARIEDLPTEAQLAKGNTAAEDAALNNINRQRAELDAQEAQLRAGRNPSARPAK